MSKYQITRTSHPWPDEKGLEVVRDFLFKCLDGIGEIERKAWRKLWGRIARMGTGDIMAAELSFTRNPAFHRKMFALLNLGFDCWNPALHYRGRQVEKNFEQFRSDVIIQAGYYDQTWSLDGQMTLRARSLSYSSMDDVEFEQVYSAIADVLLSKVLTNYKGRRELDDVVAEILGFL